MLAELLDCAKNDILANVQESIDQIYADFECVKPETRGAQSQVNRVAQWLQTPEKATRVQTLSYKGEK